MAKEKKSAAPFIPKTTSLSKLAKASQECKGCDLYKNATQAVFGEGPENARIVFIGEKPGNKEDLAGHPFVGSAGALLRKALSEAGIDPSTVYFTNAVKHFKWQQRGKTRLHKKPSMTEIRACKPWLEAELTLLRPDILICLGSTAVFTIFEKEHAVQKDRGHFFPSFWCDQTFITVHPSSILRAVTSEQRDEEYRRFVKDMILVRKKLEAI